MSPVYPPFTAVEGEDFVDQDALVAKEPRVDDAAAVHVHDLCVAEEIVVKGPAEDSAPLFESRDAADDANRIALALFRKFECDEALKLKRRGVQDGLGPFCH